MSLLLVVGLFTGCSGVSQADLDAANAQVNTLQNEVNAVNTAKNQTDANKSLVRSYYEAVNKEDYNALDQLFSSDYQRYVSALGKPLDVAGQKQRLAGMRIAFPDLQITVENLIAEGDYVTIYLTARGTHKGMLQGMIKPTGLKFTTSGFEIIRIVNGKMIEHWGGTDTFDILTQLGAILTVGKMRPIIVIGQ